MTTIERELSHEWVELFLCWLDTPYVLRASLDARMERIDQELGW